MMVESAGRQLHRRRTHRRNNLLRTAGYIISASTFFLGLSGPSGMKMNDLDTVSRAPISPFRKPLPRGDFPTRRRFAETK